jgi:membrane-associated protein
MIGDVINYVLHFEQYVNPLIQRYGVYIYPILFFIIFFETGLVVIPFLPGDSLLFVAGSFAATGALNLYWLMIIFIVAAILGDSFNYFLGEYFGKRVFKKWIKEEHIKRTEEFYEEYGPKTIVIARFIPIIRSFAPFVAGIGKMKYAKFFFYNVIGGILWVVTIVLLGYFFGTLPFIQKNFATFIIAIIIISVLPAVIEYLRQRKKFKRDKKF